MDGLEENNSMDCEISKIIEIYNMLGDDNSKEIYGLRVLYSLTNDYRYMERLISKTLPGKWLESKLVEKKGKKVLLYGAGNRGKILARIYGSYFDAVIDNNSKVWGKELEGLKIIALPEALEIYPDSVIVLSMKCDRDLISKDLMRRGISQNRILDMGEQIEKLRNGQYFDLQELKLQKEEVFVDCGAFDGDTSIEFKKWCKQNYKHIYAFEPDEDNNCLCKQNLGEDIHKRKCTVFNKGTWSSETVLEFSKNSNEASHICEDGTEKIEVLSIDAELLNKRNEKVTFIKMDIEGAELETLKGASQIIKEQKPKLAICVYHKPEDIFTIPEYLRTLNPDYKFYLRHYTFAAWDTVLYAIP